MSEGKTLIAQEDVDIINAMVAELYNHPNASKLLSFGVAEDSLFAEINGVKAKCRPDYKRPDIQTLIDLKTAADASAAGFARAIANHNYHVQAAWYLDVAYAAENIYYDQFVFICQEKKPPYAIATYVLDDESIETGRVKYQELLALYQWCRDNDSWKGYPESLQVISLPGWAKY